MRKYLLGGLITIAILGLFSYKTTNNYDSGGYHNRIIIPLKQRSVITTDDIKNVNKLIKQGYRVEFVTENLVNKNESVTTYTLIKY
jgi:hypothetical protein